VTYYVLALPIRRFLLSGPVSSTTMSTCFCRSSFTHLCHSPVRISFRSRVHGPLSFTGSQYLRRSPVTEPTSFVGPRFIHGSTDLPRSPDRFPVALSFLSHWTYPSFAGPPYVHGSTALPRSPVHISVRSRVHAPVSFPLRQSFIGCPFLCHSPVLIPFR
jgi:hypothetical protein